MFSSAKAIARWAARSLIVATTAGLFWGTPAGRAAIITVDFENNPVLAAQPGDFFTAGATQTYNSPGNYTVSGGVVLGSPTFLASFAANGSAPNLYMTADFADPSLLATITFDLPPTSFVTTVTGVLFNGQEILENYVVSAFSGLTLVSTNNLNNVPIASAIGSFANFSVTSTLALPITRVTVTTPNAGVNGWDFGVDTVRVSQNPVPEPATAGLLAIGAAWLFGFRRKGARRAGAVLTALAVLGSLVGPSALAGSPWVQQGPGPTINGQDEGIVTPQGNNPVSGCIQAVAPHPTDPTILYVAGVNGGVWKTTNATAATPAWIPLTDQALPGLSIRSLAISPLNASVLFAGAGRTSSYGSDGGAQFGIGRSLDAGATWTVVGTNLAGQNIRSIVPTEVTVSGSQVVLAGTSTGVYRSVDNGVTYTQITSGIPAASISSLERDPGVATRFYAAASGTIYRSEDTGATWVTATGAGFTVVGGARVLLSVHNSAGNDIVYAAVIESTNNTLANVYRSANQGVSWTALGVPAPVLFPGGQGSIHGAVVADRTDANTVWVSGDRQNTPFPNANGASNFSANVFRNVSGAWQNMVMNGANGTSPHADSRAMAFDAAGSIIQGNDGGVFKLNNPNLATRIWSSLNGNIVPTEAHSAAYDSLTNTAICGTQDTGTSFQVTAGGLVWAEANQGDGAKVAVDADQVAHAGISYRYSSSQGFGGFRRTTYNSVGTQTTSTTIGLNITVGAGAGQTYPVFEGAGFYNAYVLNTINPARMLIARVNLYESVNRGDSLTNLGAVGGTVGEFFTGNSAMAYGGRLNGLASPDVFYVGGGTSIRHRVTSGGAISTLTTYPGTAVRALVMDPQNYTRLYVLDISNRVWASFNEGVSWTNLTANLATFTPRARTLEIFSPSPTPLNTVLVVGGDGGVWQMRRPGAAGTAWTILTGGLPKAVVFDLRYDYTDNVMVAGTLGRGVWTLTNFFRGGGGDGVPAPTQAFAPALLSPEGNPDMDSHLDIDVILPPAVLSSGAVGD